MKNYEKNVESFKIKHELFLAGCDSIEEMGLWDKENLGEMDAFYSNDMACVIIRLIASDGQISEKEVKYFNDTFDLDYTLDELVEVYNSSYDDIGEAFDESFANGISNMRRINSKLADAYKELLAIICEIIINSDGIISDTEIEEVNRLKSLCE